MRSFAAFLSSSVWLAALVAQEPTKPESAPNEPTEPKRPRDPVELLATFAKMPGLEARYTEEKHLALLAVPLQSRGRLYFLRPGYLLREVEAPEKASLLITPKELRMKGREGTEVIDLQSSDRVHLFVTSLVQVFCGDKDALGKHYKLDFQPEPRDEVSWRLVLTPSEKPLKQMLQSLTLRGSGFAVTEIEVKDPNGDRTVTKIVGADTKRSFDADEQLRLFRIEKPAKGSAEPQPPPTDAGTKKGT
ncbi:MAG: outer membrane lipoprotein carrier protein LolA [Planctomycetota bacterium]